jgi:hypothetical protein
MRHDIRAYNLSALRHAIHQTANPAYRAGAEMVLGARIFPPTMLVSGSHERVLAAYSELAGELRGSLVFDGGLYDAAGRILQTGIHLGGNRRHLPATTAPAGATEKLSGTWLYGGVLYDHFGHFLTESLGRLWCFPSMRKRIDGVVWSLQRPVSAGKLADFEQMPNRGFHADVLNLLGVTVPHRVAIRPLEVERLIVPHQLAMNVSGPALAGDVRYRRFLAETLTVSVPAPADLSGQLYVSRAGLSGRGRFVLEEHIEEVLSAAGWRIMRPETMSISNQLAQYRAARDILFAEGSAIHLYALIANRRQRVGILFRRLPPKAKFANQLRACGLQVIHEIDAITGYYCQEEEATALELTGRELNGAETMLDFDRLGQQLVAAGFLRQRQWRSPTSVAIDAWLGTAQAGRDGHAAESGRLRLLPRSAFAGTAGRTRDPGRQTAKGNRA